MRHGQHEQAFGKIQSTPFRRPLRALAIQAADEFGDDLDFGVVDDLAPVGGEQRAREGGGYLFAVERPGAERLDDEAEA